MANINISHLFKEIYSRCVRKKRYSHIYSNNGLWSTSFEIINSQRRNTNHFRCQLMASRSIYGNNLIVMQERTWREIIFTNGKSDIKSTDSKGKFSIFVDRVPREWRRFFFILHIFGRAFGIFYKDTEISGTFLAAGSCRAIHHW
jgi:hypothetical protein